MPMDNSQPNASGMPRRQPWWSIFLAAIVSSGVAALPLLVSHIELDVSTESVLTDSFMLAGVVMVLFGLAFLYVNRRNQALYWFAVSVAIYSIPLYIGWVLLSSVVLMNPDSQWNVFSIFLAPFLLPYYFTCAVILGVLFKIK